MVMHSGGKSGAGIDPRRTPFLQAVKNKGEASDLIHVDNADDMTLILNMPDDEHSVDLAVTLSRCEKYKMEYHHRLYCNMAKLMTSVHGQQAKLFSQTAMGFGVPEFYGGENGKPKKSDQSNK